MAVPPRTEYGTSAVQAFGKENPQLAGLANSYRPTAPGGGAAPRTAFSEEKLADYVLNHPVVQQLYGGVTHQPDVSGLDRVYGGPQNVRYADPIGPRAETYGPAEMQGPRMPTLQRYVNPIGPVEMQGPQMPPGQRYANPIGPAEMQGPRFAPSASSAARGTGFLDDLSTLGGALKSGLGEVAGKFAAPVMRGAEAVMANPTAAAAVRMGGRAAPVVGLGMEALADPNAHDSVEQALGFDNMRASMDRGVDAFKQGRYADAALEAAKLLPKAVYASTLKPGVALGDYLMGPEPQPMTREQEQARIADLAAGKSLADDPDTSDPYKNAARYRQQQQAFEQGRRQAMEPAPVAARETNSPASAEAPVAARETNSPAPVAARSRSFGEDMREMLAPFEGINIHALGPILQAYQARKQIEAGQPLRDAQTNYYNSTADYNRSTRSTPRTSEVVQGQMVQLAQMMSRFEQEAANAEAQGDKARAQQIRMQKLPYQSLFDSYAKIGHGDPRALDINALVNRRLIQEQ